MEPQELAQQQVLYKANEPIDQVCFVTRGEVSLVKRLDAGETIEIATVGPEGMIGTTLALGSDSADHRAIVQVPAKALCMRASIFKRVAKDSRTLQNLLMRYTVSLLNQVAQSAACNRVHAVDERCARWLLMTHDRVKIDSFPLTHEFHAQMLGVHRPTVRSPPRCFKRRGTSIT